MRHHVPQEATRFESEEEMREEWEIKNLLDKALKCEIHDYDRQGGIIEALRWVLGSEPNGGLKDVIDSKEMKKS